jgi:hypothetical protein
MNPRTTPKTKQAKDAGSGQDVSPSATEDAGMRRFAGVAVNG